MSVLSTGTPGSTRLAEGRGQQHVSNRHLEYRCEPAQERNGHVRAGLDPLDGRGVDASALGELHLAPLIGDAEFECSQTDLSSQFSGLHCHALSGLRCSAFHGLLLQSVQSEPKK